jgi:hypothetical protein
VFDGDPATRALIGPNKKDAARDSGCAHWAEMVAPRQSWLQQLASRMTGWSVSGASESWQR